MTEQVEKMKKGAERAAKKVARQPWVEPVMRLGYAVRGLLYGLVGFLAVQVALGGQGGRFTDRKGAIAALASQPIGRVVLILIIAGLVGYALWGLLRAVLDPFKRGSGPTGLAARAGYLGEALSYGGLVIPTLRLLLNVPGGAQPGSSEQTQEQVVGTVMRFAWGPWLVGAVGLGVMAVGAWQVLQGWRANFEMRFDSYALNARQRRWATRIGRFGTIARGLVFGLIGLFLLLAALKNNPAEVRGVDGTLLELSRQPYGPYLLGVVAGGLVAYGVYSLLGAAWFRFKHS